MMTVGSLFAGIGGFDLGLERAGMCVRWQCEINEWCRRVLAKHWPHVKRYGDITTIDWSTVEPVDVLCGGFPCQDISLAGKGAGLSGERSGLWFEYARAIEALKPRYIIIENVAALRSRGLDQVLGSLAALGYDAEWHCLPACSVGAPHRRDRVWIVAYTGRISCVGWSGERGGQETAGPCDRAARSSQHAVDVAHTQPLGQQEQWQPLTVDAWRELERVRTEYSGWWGVEPELGRVAHGIPNRVDRLRGLGNAVVPQIVEAIGRMIIRRVL